jgi:hypothetical protein
MIQDCIMKDINDVQLYSTFFVSKYWYHALVTNCEEFYPYLFLIGIKHYDNILIFITIRCSADTFRSCGATVKIMLRLPHS